MISVENRELVRLGRFVRLLKLEAEGWEFVDSPERFIGKLRSIGNLHGDIFTFVKGINQETPVLAYHSEPDPIAVLEIESYEKWWKDQISDKTRNMIRKAGKKSVVIRMAEFNDELIRGIQGIQNESPFRQGMPFWHYGKDFNTTKSGHETFLDRSEFIGAYLGSELIGYIKLVYNNQTWAGIMQIISKMSHRDKAPTNALMAKAVEVCASRNIRYLSYGIWSTRSLGDFKMKHGYMRHDLPRYFVPLNLRGDLALRLKLHRRAADYLPVSCRDSLAELRAKWYSFKHRQAHQ